MVKRRPTLKRTVFLDSSVIFAAVCSPTGGSSKLFTLKNIQLATSPVVLAEVERNVRAKLETYHLDRFFLLVSQLRILSQKPRNQLIKKAKKYTHPKDVIVLSEAKEAKLDLITLDRKHLLTESAISFLKPRKSLAPKQLLER